MNLYMQAHAESSRRIRRGAPGAPTPTTALSCATDPEPCAHPEPLAKVLDQIVRVIAARVHCSNAAADAVALWCVATWGVSSSGPDYFRGCTCSRQ